MSVNSTIFEPVSKSYWKCTIHGHDNIIKIWTRGGSPINIDSLYIGLPPWVQILGAYLTDRAIIKIWTRGGSPIYIDSLNIGLPPRVQILWTLTDGWSHHQNLDPRRESYIYRLSIYRTTSAGPDFGDVPDGWSHHQNLDTRRESYIYRLSIYIYRTTSAGPDFGDVPTHGNEAML